jgi:hypothetical protein
MFIKKYYIEGHIFREVWRDEEQYLEYKKMVDEYDRTTRIEFERKLLFGDDWEK